MAVRTPRFIQFSDWVASSVIPEGADESIRWEIPLDTPGRYFRFEPEE